MTTASRFTLLIASAALALACAPAGAERQQRPADRYGLVSAEIVDRTSGAPMVAHRIGLPEGWSVKGDVVWGVSTCEAPARVTFDAASPDTGIRIFSFGTDAWASPNAGASVSCNKADIAGMEDYLRAVLKQGVKDVQIGAYTASPLLLQSSAEQLKLIRAQTGTMAGWSARAEGGYLRYSAVVDGKAVDGAILASAVFTTIDMPGHSQWSDGKPVKFGTTTASMVIYAPKGKLDVDLALAVWSSITVDKAWQDHVARMTRNRHEMNGARH